MDTLVPGNRVDGRYEIVRFIASGGMGSIYAARQLPLGRPVALKVMRQELASDETLAKRFAREAQTVSQLQHSHTIILFDYGIDPNGTLYLAMEWLDGQDLGALVKREGRVDPVRAAKIAAQVARSLSEAHNKGIVHRDLKPENIFLVNQEGDPDFVKVLDFGIAKMAIDEPRTQITRIGMVCGTPEFMSPEQGRGEPLDGRSDLYSLGSVLYNLLVGSAPFEASNPLAVVMRHQTEPIPDLPAHIPYALKDIVWRATQKQVEHRFATAEEMAGALEHFCEQQAALGHNRTQDVPVHHHTQPLMGSASLVTPAPLTPGAAAPRPIPSTVTVQASSGSRLPLALWIVVAVLLIGGLGAGVAFLLWPREEAVEAAPAAKPDEELVDNAPSTPSLPAGELAPVLAPQRPETLVPAINPCAKGQLITEDTRGHCCWPGQSWSSQKDDCIGIPSSCPEGTETKLERCIPLPDAVVEDTAKCKAGSAEGCDNALGYYRSIFEPSASDRIAIRALSTQLAPLAVKRCEQQAKTPCIAAAQAFLAGEPSLHAKGLELAEAACVARDAAGCEALYVYYADFADQGVADPAKAAEYEKKICDLVGAEHSRCQFPGSGPAPWDDLAFGDDPPTDGGPKAIPIPTLDELNDGIGDASEKLEDLNDDVEELNKNLKGFGNGLEGLFPK